jgi:hypothetical protein
LKYVIPKIVNKYKESYDIYIGRGSVWGNPYKIGIDGDRQEVIKKYRRHLWSNLSAGKISVEEILSLSGKRLGCYCKPKYCHGDVIISAFKWVLDKEINYENEN